MKKIYSLFILLILGGWVSAQNLFTLKGEVTDEQGNPLSNVEVSVKNVTISTQTNASGNFELRLEKGEHTLLFFVEGFNIEKQDVSLNENEQKISVHLHTLPTRNIAEILINVDRKLQVNRLNIKNLEAPMTINVLGAEMLQQLDINNLQEASRNIAGINSVNLYGGFQFFNIRGFDNFVLLYDGIRDERHNIAQSAPSSNFANVERIEVLKGPSGEMFGHSALGAIINVIRKKPTKSLHANAKFGVGSYDTFNAVVGAGGPITTQLRYRLDFGTSNSNGWKNVNERTNNMSLMLQFLPTKKDSFEFFTQYNKDQYGPDTGVPSDHEGKPLEGVDPLVNYADPNDYIKNDKKEIYLKYSHKFSDNTTLNNTVSYYNDHINYLMDEVLFYDPNTKNVSRYNGPYHFKHITKPLTEQLDLSFSFNTGRLKHKSVIGSSFSYLDRKTLYGDTSNGKRGESISEVMTLKEQVLGVYFQNWTTFSSRFKSLMGFRYDHFSGIYDEKRPIEEPQKLVKSKVGNVTYRFALSYQPIKEVLSTYASVSSFFKPTRMHDHKSGKIFKPESGFQIESGIKLERKKAAHLTLSAFYIEKNNLIVGHQVRTQGGTAISKGIELDADVQLLQGMYLKAGYTLTNAYFAASTPELGDPDISHNQTPWTPKHLFNTWLNYEFQNQWKGLGLGLGGYYTAKTFQNQYNNQTLPAYTLINGSIYYKANNQIRIGLNIENLAGIRYYRSALSSNDLYANDPAQEDQVAPMQVYPGKGRNFRLNISYDF